MRIEQSQVELAVYTQLQLTYVPVMTSMTMAKQYTGRLQRLR